MLRSRFPVGVGKLSLWWHGVLPCSRGVGRGKYLLEMGEEVLDQETVRVDVDVSPHILEMRTLLETELVAGAKHFAKTCSMLFGSEAETVIYMYHHDLNNLPFFDRL
jgi:ribosomal protein S18 acetylase RimI-like enzyme